MPGVSIIVTDEDVMAVIGRLIDAGRDMQAFFEHLGPSMVGSTQNRFPAETDPQGRKWKALRPATIRAKRGDTRILRRRGHLLSSLSYSAEPTHLVWGSNLAYARIQQLGGTIEMPARQQDITFARTRRGQTRFAKKRSKAKSRTVKSVSIGAYEITIPARPYLGVSEADKAHIISEANAYLNGALGVAQ